MGRQLIQLAGAGQVGPQGPQGPAVEPPLNVGAISVSGFIDPISAEVTLTVSVTPPATGLFAGCHLYLELPDQSATGDYVAGTSVLGGTDTLTGTWAPIDLGIQPYLASEQPWTLVFPGPASLNSAVDTPARLYAASFSPTVDNPLVRAGLPDATPDQTFTLVSLSSGTPTSGTNITATSGAIAAVALPVDNTTGKLRTPVLVMVSSVPNITGWCGRVLLTWGDTDATLEANRQVMSDVFTQAGPVYGSPDGVPIPHTFALDTPKTVQKATLWLQSGLVDIDGNYQWNNVVPGITPCWPITLGTNNGTTDAASVMLTTIKNSMAVVDGLFGVADKGITNPLMGDGAVATLNIQNLAVTNPLLGSLAVQAGNLAYGSVTAGNQALAALAVGYAAMQFQSVYNATIANLAVSGAKIQNLTVTNSNLGYASIASVNLGSAVVGDANIADAAVTTLKVRDASITSAKIAFLSVGNAHIQDAQITDAKIVSCNVQKLTAGTANFSGDVTFSRGVNLPYVKITNASVELGYGAAGTPNLKLAASTVKLSSGATANVTLDSTGQAMFTSASGTSGWINGNVASFGQSVTTGLLILNVGTIQFPVTAISGSASAGYITLPTAQGFLSITIGATTYKIPYFNA